MTAPNIAGLTTVTGKTVSAALGTSDADLLSNAASSNKVFKINSLTVSNIDGSATTSVTIILRKGSTDYHIARQIDIPPRTTMVIIKKDTQIYLEENDKIRGRASVAFDLEMVCSYEEIS